MDKGDIKAEKMLIQTLSFNQLKRIKKVSVTSGYNFYQQNKDKLKEVKIKDDKGKDTEPTKKTIQDNSYALSRPLFIYAKEKSLKDNKAFQEFMKFTLEDKGKAAEDAGYVALPKKDYKEELKDLKKYIKKNSKDSDKNLIKRR